MPAAAVAAIRIDRDGIRFVFIERRAVRHRNNRNPVSRRLRDIHRVHDSGGGIIVVRTSRRFAVLFEQNQMVVRAAHLIEPLAVRIFKRVVNFPPGQAHGVKQIFVFIQIEQVARENFALTDGGIERKRRGKGNIGLCQLKLRAMNQVNKRRIAKHRLPRGNRRRKPANRFIHVGFHVLNRLGETRLKFRVRRKAFDVNQFAGDGLLLPVQRDIGDRDRSRRMRSAENQHRRSGLIGDGFLRALMIVAGEYHVKARHAPRHEFRRVFIHRRVRCRPAIGKIHAGMKQADQNIRALRLLNQRHPVCRAFHHVRVCDALPQIARQPVRDARRRQAKHRDFHAAALQHGIRAEIWLIRAGFQGVRR